MDASYILAAGSAMLQMGLFCVIGSLFGRFPRPEGLLSQASLKTLSSCVYWLFTPALLLTTFGAKLTPETLASAATCFAWSLLHAIVNFIVGAKVMGCMVPIDPELVAAYELAVTYNNGASVPLLVFAGLTRSTPQLRGDTGAYDRSVGLIFAYVLLWNFTFWSVGVAHIERNAARLRAARAAAAAAAATAATAALPDLESADSHSGSPEQRPSGRDRKGPPPLSEQSEAGGSGGYDARPLGPAGLVAGSGAAPAATAPSLSVLFAPAAGAANSADGAMSVFSRQHWEAALYAGGGIAWRAFRKAIITPPVLGIIGGVVIGLSGPLRSLLFVPGGALQPIGDVLALVGQPSVPCSNLILGGSLYHGLADLWRIVQWSGSLQLWHTHSPFLQNYRRRKALGVRTSSRKSRPVGASPSSPANESGKKGAAAAGTLRASASASSLAEVADEDDTGDGDHAAATPLHTPRVVTQPPQRIPAALASVKQQDDAGGSEPVAPSPILRARQGSVIGGSGQQQRARGPSAAAVQRPAPKVGYDDASAWSTGVDEAALEESAFDHLTRVTMAVAAVPMLPVDAQMHCDDRDDIILQSSEILRAASMRVRTGRAASGAPPASTPAAAVTAAAAVTVASRVRAASSRSARAGSSGGGGGAGELELPSAIIRAASRRGVRASSFQAPPAVDSRGGAGGGAVAPAAAAAAAEEGSAGFDNSAGGAGGDAEEGGEHESEEGEEAAVDVRATLRLGALLLAARLVVCPALLFGLFAACVAGAVPVLAPAPGDSVLALLILVEACAPSAQSVLLLCQMTGQARAAKSLSVVFLAMYPASLVTMTVWISVAMAMVFG